MAYLALSNSIPYRRDLQGQDVAVFSVTHPQMMCLDPAHLRDLMLMGRPQSALCALDFVSQVSEHMFVVEMKSDNFVRDDIGSGSRGM